MIDAPAFLTPALLPSSCPRPFEMCLRAGTTPRAGNDRPRRLSCFGFGPSFSKRGGAWKGTAPLSRRSTIFRWERAAFLSQKCPAISSVSSKFRGRKNRQWTGVVSLSSRRLLPTVFLTLVILEVVMSWQLLLRTAGASWSQLLSIVWRASHDMDTEQLCSISTFDLIAINQVFRSEALGNIADRTEPPISRGPHSAKCQPCHAIFPPTPAPLALSLPSLGRKT